MICLPVLVPPGDGPLAGWVRASSSILDGGFKCAGCGKQYSVTSGTIFASRKLSFMDLCGAVAIFVNAVKGLSALQLGRDLSVSYKTAWVLAHKLRESLGAEMKGFGLAGEVEIDGAYFGGSVRPENRKEDRKDRRLKEHQTGERRTTADFAVVGRQANPLIPLRYGISHIGFSIPKPAAAGRQRVLVQLAPKPSQLATV